MSNKLYHYDDIITITKCFLWSEVEVHLDKEHNTYSAESVGGIYHIFPQNTTGEVREIFENNLIDGSDRFLVAVREVSPDGYKFKMIMHMHGYDIDDFHEFVNYLADIIVQKEPQAPIVMSIE